MTNTGYIAAHWWEKKAPTVTNRIYTLHYDSGHGWLKVPKAVAREFNLAVSRYSYQDATHVYLEEDCDFGLFVDAYLVRHGHPPTIDEHFDGDRSPIRNLTRGDN